MKKLGLVPLVLAAVILGVAPSAQAIPITFSTQGSFNGGAFADIATVTHDKYTLTFDGVTDVTLSTPASSVSLGGFTLTAGPPPRTRQMFSEDFDLRILVSDPGPLDFGDLDADVSGKVRLRKSTIKVLFNDPSVTINGVRFTLDPLEILVPRPKDHVEAPVKADVTVPEPASLVLLGIGLLGFAGIARVGMRQGGADRS